ncbi:MAG: flippase-like domain-containing protein [Proteobacteria bacterium]|nr:flippase-like domain-containing protein [Pseudomonadota bacterium]
MSPMLRRLFFSTLIGVAMLWLASRQISFSALLPALGRAQWWVLLPYFAVMALQHGLRVWRWGLLLAPIHPVGFRRLLPISSVGFFAIFALPLRMGEFVRPYLVADPPRLRFTQALGTLVVERVFDGLVVALLAFSAVALARLDGVVVPAWLTAAGVLALGLFCAAAVVLVIVLWQRERAVTLCRRVVALIAPRLADRAAAIAAGIVDGFRLLPDARRLLPFLLATTGYWVLNAAALWVLAQGFALGLTPWQATALVALIGVGIMIPAGPGFIGNFELFANGALALYVPAGLLHQRGAAFIVTSHLANAAWYLGVGAMAMLSTHVGLRRLVGDSARAAAAAQAPNAPAGDEVDSGSAAEEAAEGACRGPGGAKA